MISGDFSSFSSFMPILVSVEKVVLVSKSGAGLEYRSSLLERLVKTEGFSVCPYGPSNSSSSIRAFLQRRLIFFACIQI